jgi:chorismate dehydratase
VSQTPVRIASVAYVNARPLVHGLDRDPDYALRFAVPSRLIDDLLDSHADVVLLPVVDYACLHGLRIIPVGAIGCDGPTLTVRLFSASPIEQTRVLACDGDSHTSVALARVIFKHRFGLSPEIIPLEDATGREGETRLLIGDKVVCAEPPGLPNQLDLGQAWKELTGLPFVFAAWVASPDFAREGVGPRLLQARRAGLAQVNEIVRTHAVPRGWPEALARTYLTEYLKFDFGEAQLRAIEHFHTLAKAIDALPGPLRPIVVDPMA